MYLDLLAALEGSWLGHVGRHSAWLYTAANLLHVLGAAFVVGGIAVFDLKVLAEHGKHAWQVGRYAIPLAATGLALQIPTGVLLLAVEARALGMNPAFYVKLAFIALGLDQCRAVSRPFRIGAARLEPCRRKPVPMRSFR